MSPPGIVFIGFFADPTKSSLLPRFAVQSGEIGRFDDLLFSNTRRREKCLGLAWLSSGQEIVGRHAAVFELSLDRVRAQRFTLRS